MTQYLLSAQQRLQVDLAGQLTRGRRQGLQSTKAKHLERKLSGIKKKENKCNDSAGLCSRGPTQKTNNESVVWKFEGNKILVG